MILLNLIPISLRGFDAETILLQGTGHASAERKCLLVDRTGLLNQVNTDGIVVARKENNYAPKNMYFFFTKLGVIFVRMYWKV